VVVVLDRAQERVRHFRIHRFASPGQGLGGHSLNSLQDETMTISSPCNRSGGKWRKHPYLDDHHLRLRRLSLMFEEGTSSLPPATRPKTSPLAGKAPRMKWSSQVARHHPCCTCGFKRVNGKFVQAQRMVLMSCSPSSSERLKIQPRLPCNRGAQSYLHQLRHRVSSSSP